MSRDTLSQATQSQSNKVKPIDFNDAAVLNDDGTETPITEQMVRDACQQLDSEKNGQQSG